MKEINDIFQKSMVKIEDLEYEVLKYPDHEPNKPVQITYEGFMSGVTSLISMLEKTGTPLDDIADKNVYDHS